MAGRRSTARPTVRWNESKGRWMAWVRFPDGSRRKVERVDKAEAQQELDRLLRLRTESGEAPEPKRRASTFGEVIDGWFEAGCPTVTPSRVTRHARVKSASTIANAHHMLDASVRVTLGGLVVERTKTDRLEAYFQSLADSGLSTSTVDRKWVYLNQACQWALKQRLVGHNPAADVLLPARRAPKERKAFTIEQAQVFLTVALPSDRRPAMWLTGLMCGLRPGELAGLRWPYVDIDGDDPAIAIVERAAEVNGVYVSQAAPKTPRSRRRIGLHPLLVGALAKHREEQRWLGLYEPEGFVFATSNGTAPGIRNLRRDFGLLCEQAGLGKGWTTYELRHSFVSLVSDQLDDLVKVADLAGHTTTRTTQGYRHAVRPSLPHAIEAWERLLAGPSTP